MKFGGWITIGSVIAPFLTNGERLVLSSTLGVTAAAYYCLPADAISRALIAAGSLSVAYFPRFAVRQGPDGRESERETYFGALKEVTILTGIPIVVVAVRAHDILNLWLGTEFANEGAHALSILSAGTLFLAMAHIPVTFSQAVGQPWLPVRRHLLEVPIHVLAVVGLGRAYGLVGFAAAWSLRTFIDVALQHAAAERLMRGPAWTGGRSLLRVVLLLGAQAVTTVFLSGMAGAPSSRVAVAVAVAAMTAVAAWQFGVSRDERLSLLREFRRTRR